jgi:hypothetical protein
VIAVVALAPDVRLRLIKFAGMLGSIHPGERDAAIGKCNELLRANNATWEEALTPTPLPAPPPTPPPPMPRSWRAVAEELLVFHANALRTTPRYDEPQFLQDLCDRGWAPSPRQAKWLADIARRCGLAVWDGYSP